MTENIILGLVLLAIGLNIILKTVFKLDLPIFKWLLAGFLISWGISLLMGYDDFLPSFTCTRSKVVIQR